MHGNSGRPCLRAPGPRRKVPDTESQNGEEAVQEPRSRTGKSVWERGRGSGLHSGQATSSTAA